MKRLDTKNCTKQSRGIMHLGVAVVVIAFLMPMSGCTSNADTPAPDASQGGSATNAVSPATGQLTAEQNKAKAMASIENNPSMTPEQKAAMKAQVGSMGKKP